MYKNIQDVTIESLRKNCTLIHYFGLGFIQVKLGPKYRMHFYTKELPAITSEEDVHNHRYNFRSVIFWGNFTQEIFSVTDGNTHLLEAESCKEGVKCDAKPVLCDIKKMMEHNFLQGSSYEISHEVFHRVRSDGAITFLELGPVEKELAEVARPVGGEFVCPFSKKIPESDLWRIVAEMISIAKS